MIGLTDILLEQVRQMPKWLLKQHPRSRSDEIVQDQYPMSMTWHQII